MAIAFLFAMFGCSKKDGALCIEDHYFIGVWFSNYAPSAGESVELNAIIANGILGSLCGDLYQISSDTIGTQALIEVYFKASDNSYELAGSCVIDVRPIMAGDTATIKQYLTFFQPGTYTLGLTCDASNLITESNESNNLYGYRKKRSISLGTITVSKPTGSMERHLQTSSKTIKTNSSHFKITTLNEEDNHRHHASRHVTRHTN